MKNFSKNFLIIFLVFLFVTSLFSLYLPTSQPPEAVGIGTLIEKINQEQVQTIKVIENQLTVTLKDQAQLKITKEASESLSSLLKNFNVDPEKLKNIKITVEPETG